MNIGVVTNSLPEDGHKTGGVPVVAHRLAEEYVKLGHEVEVFSFNKPPEGAQYSWRCIPSKGIFVLLKLPIFELMLVSIWLSFQNMKKYDVVHFHGLDTFFISNVPWMRTLHGSCLREKEHTANKLRKIVLMISYWTEKISALRANRVLCIGSDTKEIYGLEDTDLIGNPVNLADFRPGNKTEKPQIFYNGYWNGRKRGKFIYRVFVDEILPKFPDANLVMLANECPPHPRVTLVNGVTDSELQRFYRESWVFAYPSTYEGFGLAYVEAMASGTAVVATDNPGVRDVADGCAVIANDSEFGESIINILSDENIRKNLEKLGLNRAKLYESEDIAKEYLSKLKLISR